MKKNFYKKERGITLIALVITIIVLLILAGVSISMLSGENGILNRAAEAKEKTGTEQVEEEEALNSYEEMINGYVDGSTGNSGNGGDTGTTEPENPEETPETISTTENYVGYYADLEGDGIVDGIIYADLVAGAKGDGKWGTDGIYTLPKVTNAKNYYVSQQSYEGAFGTKAVLSPTGTGNDRFYVMALEDFTTDSDSTFYWYYSAYTTGMNDYSTYTSEDFETGKSNTEAMITKWNSSGYGAQNARDVWGVIQDKVNDGWFVPSKAELAAFYEELQITSNNYGNYGLGYCLSSSQKDTNYAWYADLDFMCMGGVGVNVQQRVRLCTTF